MNLINRLLLAPINDLNGEEFRESFQNLTSTDRHLFVEKTIYNQFSPVLLYYINNNNLEDLFIDKYLTDLRNQSKRFQIQSLETIKEIIFLDKIFKKNNINAVFLKGAAMMNEYSDVSLRPLVDIDILVEKKEVFYVYNILKSNSYNESSSVELKERDFNKYIESHHHLPELSRSSNIMVEIHHRLTSVNDFKNCPLSERVINNKILHNFYGANIYLPSINDLISHSLIHFSLSNGFNKSLRIFNDIYQLEKKYDIDWIQIYSLNNGKFRKAVSLSLEILNYHFEFTNNFSDLKMKFKDYFPEKKIIESAYKETFDLKNATIPKKTFLKLGNSKGFFNFLRKVFNRIFINNYDINYYSFTKFKSLNYFLSYCYNTFFRFITYFPMIFNLFFKRGSIFERFKRLKRVEEWLN